MKRTILFLLLTAAAFCACKKEDSTPVDGISFKADGVLKTVKGCQGRYFKSVPNDFSRVLIIGRTDNDEQMILDVMGTISKPYMSQATYYAVPMSVDSARYRDNTSGTINI